jgi:hypothetical protein
MRGSDKLLEKTPLTGANDPRNMRVMTTNLLPKVKSMDYWQGKKANRFDDVIVENEGNNKQIIIKETGNVALMPALSTAAATMLFDASCNLLFAAKKKQDTKLMLRWFGDRITTEEVTKKLDTMIDYLQQNSLKVRYSREKLQSLGAYDPNFYPRQVSQLGKPILYTRYSWGEKVMTFLHELSHVVIGTLDKGEKGTKIPLPNDAGGACYGPYALKLAKNDLKDTYGLGQADAVNNAENWGYFIVSHYTHIGVIDSESKYSKAELLGYDDEYKNLDDKTLGNVTLYLKGRDEKPGVEKADYYGSGKGFDKRITDT